VGNQPLNDRNVRRISEATGLDLVRVVAHGGTHWLSIVTADHRHGSYLPATGEVSWDEPAQVVHFTSCRRLFPEGERSA
jgi:alkaline phosphatase